MLPMSLGFTSVSTICDWILELFQQCCILKNIFIASYMTFFVHWNSYKIQSQIVETEVKQICEELDGI
jgi:hypothetical protein